MKFAFITEKRWRVETEGSFNLPYGIRTIMVEKFWGIYLFNIIPLKIVQLDTEFYK
jgi:hypothetical protein